MIPEYYAMADIVVVPTTKPEPFGPIYLESMACGKPIVSFDVGGGEQDLVSNEKNGILVKNKDVDQMAKAIIKILKDKDLQRSMGAHSRKIIEIPVKEMRIIRPLEFLPVLRLLLRLGIIFEKNSSILLYNQFVFCNFYCVFHFVF